jgi:hypothetical protein
MDPLPDTLELTLPDWSKLDTVRRHHLPFALWQIGDQSLLFHWFDHAVNAGFKRIRIHTSDRPREVEKAARTAILWPIEREVVHHASESQFPDHAIRANRLPLHPELAEEPTDGWGLISHAAVLEKAWLDGLPGGAEGDLLCVGSSCQIHPEATLHPPYFIGDHVLIGPGCEIGPHAVIGNGSLLAGASRIVRSHVAPSTYLGAVTGLDDCLLDGGILYNLRHRVRIGPLEPHVSGSLAVQRARSKPSLGERWLAWRLAGRLGGAGRSPDFLETHDGRKLPGGAVQDLSTRVSWLPQVWRGNMRLFGVLPRTSAQMESLSAEWRELIGQAPIGVFSYADCHGCHSPEDEEEAVHAVHQAGFQEGVLPILLDYVNRLTPDDFDS